MRVSADPVPEDLITTTAACRLAQCHIASLYRWLAAGKLRCWKRLGRVFVSRGELLDLFQEREPVRPTAAQTCQRARSPSRREREQRRAMENLKRFGL